MKRRNNPRVPVALHKALEEIWGTAPGWWGRLSAVNHTIVGKRFMATAFCFFVAGGLLAMLQRAQLATPRSAFMGPEIYNQVFTMHGTVMMFLFAIPMIEGMAMYLLPKMLGARDLAFPRLSAFGYWCYLFGGSIVLLSLLAGVAPDAGWFMYTPLSAKPYSPGINSDIWLIGITFVEISAVSAAVEIVVSVLKLRAPGMSLARLPIFAWYMLVTGFMMLVGFPPLILASILLELERAFGWPFFDPQSGGDPLLWQHLFWLFGHPEVYIIFLPGAAIVSTVLPVLSRRPLVGYGWVVVALVALGFLSFGLWVHHMFAVGIPYLALAFFSAASLMVVIPTGIQVFSWLATLLSGRPQLRLPMQFILGFFFIFIAGGLTGVMVAVVPFDWQVHDTHFVVAHFHYVLVGGLVFPLMAATYYWLPSVTGRERSFRLGNMVFWLVFLGFNMTFLVMHLTGLLGMPRRVFSYAPGLGWDWPNLVSSIGGFLMTMGFALFLVDLLLQFRYGRVAPRNPWQAETLEWAIPTPPTSYAFASLPHVASRQPLRDDPDLPNLLAQGGGYLGFARHGWPETLAVGMVDGRPEQVVRLPRPTHLPLYTALATGLFFLSALAGQYWLCILAAAAIAGLALAWTRSTGERQDLGPLPVGFDLALPLHVEHPRPPSWWALVFTLVADATLFGSLLFGCFYLLVVAPGWPPPQALAPLSWPALATAGTLLAAALAGGRAVAAALAGSTGLRVWLLLCAAAQLASCGLLAVALALGPDPAGHAYAAVLSALTWFVLIHAGIGVLFAVHALWRDRGGWVSPRRATDVRLAALWQGFAAATGILALAAGHLLPLAS